jgi:hypothetical protein
VTVEVSKLAERSPVLDTGAGAQHHVGSSDMYREGLMASKDKGTKASKKPAKQTLKEKRKAKKSKKSS